MKIGTLNQLLFKSITGFILLTTSGWALSQTSFSILPQNDTIGPGSGSTLVFAINNTSPNVVDSMSFNHALPPSVTIGEVSTNECDGTLDASSGGSNISLVDGQVSANTLCQIRVSVTSSAVGTHTFPVTTLSTSANSPESAASDLTVVTNRPGFTQSLLPGVVNLGEPSTLTYSINNTSNTNFATNIQFTNTLPVGISFAEPNNLTTDCTGATPTLVGDSLTVFGVIALAGTSCTLQIDVIGSGVGVNSNQTSDLTSSTAGPVSNSGFSEASLTVNAGSLHLQKSFLDDPTPPGGVVQLEYSVINFDRSTALGDIQFSDNLAAVLPAVLANNLPLNDACGSGSSLTFVGGSVVLSGGELPAEGSCDFIVELTIDAGTAAGNYLSTSGAISANRGGSPELGNSATAQLVVSPAPLISKLFLNDPVAAGGSVDLEFTISNTSLTSAATGINFIDELTTFLPFPVSATLPANGFCGAGSVMSIAFLGTDMQGLSMTGGELPAGGSCTFVVTLDIPIGMPSGTFVNTTEAVSATVDGTVVSGNQAVDTLDVVGAPSLSKSFIDDPVLPGDTVTLEFSLSHGAEEAFDATDMAFTDDLDATLSGLVAVGLPVNDVCGTGSSFSGTNLLSLTGGTLMPGETCTFTVTLQVPVAAAFGSYTNTTSELSATVGGVGVANVGATDDLNLSGMDFTITNIPDTFISGVGVTYNLEFSLTNLSPVDDATGIFTTVNLSSVIPGLAATGVPLADTCGPGSSVTGTNFLIFVGGNLTAGNSCTFSVQVIMPNSVPVGDYTFTTSNLSYTSGASPIVADPASDTLSVVDGLLFEKSFSNDPVSAGDTVTLSFDITNNSNDDVASAIGFSDDLDATLSGLVAVGLPLTDVCGIGSQISGAGLLTFTGGNIPAGASCQFSVTLQVPANASGGNYVNTTSTINGMMAGGMVSGSAATDELQIRALVLSKSFAAAVAAGSTVDLTFELTNEDSFNSQSGIRFSDDLSLMIAGAVAIGLPISDVCGAGSLLSGTDVITLINATLSPSDSCQFTVAVSVPAVTPPGMYLNVTSDVTAGDQSGEPATDTLTVVSAPLFSKAFSVPQENLDQTFTLSFDVNNSGSTLPANNLSFSDSFPAGLAVATPANVGLNCVGGTVTAVAGSNVVSYVGGSVAAGSSCQLSVDVIGTSAGTKNNVTGDLTSSNGNSGPATANVDIVGAPLFSKAFSLMQASLNQVTTLTLTIDNSASPLPVTAIDFVDNFPAGLFVATPANAFSTCNGGALTAVSGTGTVSYTNGSVAATTTCSVSVDVIGTSAGVKNNVTGDLTSSAGNSGTAAADIEIFGALAINKSFADLEVDAGDLVDVNFAIQNNNAVAITDISFSDDLDAFIPGAVAVGLPQNDSCGLGSMVSGTNIINVSAGQLAAGETCVITVSVEIPLNINGSFVNQTSPISYTINGNPVIDEPNTAGSASLSVLGEPVVVPVNQYTWLMLLILLLVTFKYFKTMRRF